MIVLVGAVLCYGKITSSICYDTATSTVINAFMHVDSVQVNMNIGFKHGPFE